MHRALATLLALGVATPAFAGFEASSFKSESKLGKNYWNAGAALDMRSETCWQVDPERRLHLSGVLIPEWAGEGADPGVQLAFDVTLPEIRRAESPSQ